MNLLRLTDARYSIIRETLVGKRFPTEYFVYISFENSTLLLLSSYRSTQTERIRDFQTRLELFRFESIASVHTCIRRQKFFSNVAGRGGNGINLARSISSLLARSLKTFFLVEGGGGIDTRTRFGSSCPLYSAETSFRRFQNICSARSTTTGRATEASVLMIETAIESALARLKFYNFFFFLN